MGIGGHGGHIKEATAEAASRRLLSMRAYTSAARGCARIPSRPQRFGLKRNRESWIEPTKQTQPHLTYHNRAKCLFLMLPCPCLMTPCP